MLNVEDSFQAGEKVGTVFLDLTALYDTVWLRGLYMKLLETILDKHIVEFIMEMLSICSFQLHTSSSQCSRLRHIKNCVPQSSVLEPLLFNIYIYDLPSTQLRKYGYADNLAILFSKPSWKAAEEALNEDMVTLSTYFKKCHCKLMAEVIKLGEPSYVSGTVIQHILNYTLT